MKLYRVEVEIAGSMYIKAESEEKAQTIAREQHGKGIYLYKGMDTEIKVSGLLFQDPNLPDISLSPCMTLIRSYNEGEMEEADVLQ